MIIGNAGLYVLQVKFRVRPGGRFGLQSSGCSADAHDEPARRGPLPGDAGLLAAGQSQLEVQKCAKWTQQLTGFI